MANLESLSFDQLKRKWIALKGHLAPSVNQFDIAVELPIGMESAYSKVTNKILQVEEVLEAMEIKSMTKEHAIEVGRGFQECDQILKGIGDKIRVRHQSLNNNGIDQVIQDLTVVQRPNWNDFTY